MSNPKPDTEQLRIKYWTRLTPVAFDRLKKVCEAEDRSVSWMIRAAVLYFLTHKYGWKGD